MSKPKVREFVESDPLAAVLPNSIYVKLIEGKYPHVPSTKLIEQAIKMMTAEELEATRNRAKQVKEVAVAVERALG